MSSDSEMFHFWFSTIHYLEISEQRWKRKSVLNSAVTAIFLAIACLFWLPKMPASGWGSLWESSSFVPWFVLNAFRDITGVVPDLPWISGFMRKSSFTWVKWVGNVSLYRNYPQNFRSIRMYSVLYPESNFWWVFRKGSGMVPETFQNTFLGSSSKFFLIYCCQLFLVSGCHFLGKILISCSYSIIFLLKENQFEVFTFSNITTKGINNTG